MSITIIQDRSMLIDIIVYLLFVITFNYSNWTYKEFLPSVLIIGVYTAINFSEYKINVLMPLLVIQSISAIKLRRYLWINLFVMCGMLLYMQIKYGLGNNMASIYSTDRKVRMSFGFNHPNVAAMYYYCAIVNGMLLLGYSKWKKVIPFYLILVIPIWLFIYKKTGSRSFILSIVLLYFSYVYYYIGSFINRKRLFVLSKYLIYTLLFLFTGLTLYFSLNNTEYFELNRLLSGRLSFYNKFFSELTVKDFFFGSEAYGNYIIDSSYVHLLFEAGIFFFLFFCYFYWLGVNSMIKEKAWIPICVIISFLAYGLMETFLLYGMLIGTNIFWVLLYFYYRNGKMVF